MFINENYKLIERFREGYQNAILTISALILICVTRILKLELRPEIVRCPAYISSLFAGHAPYLCVAKTFSLVLCIA
jgi:hypothetical protein